MTEKVIKKTIDLAEKMAFTEKDASFQSGLRHTKNKAYFKAKKELKNYLLKQSLEDLKTVLLLKTIGENQLLGITMYPSETKQYDSMDKAQLIDHLMQPTNLYEILLLGEQTIKKEAQI